MTGIRRTLGSIFFCLAAVASMAGLKAEAAMPPAGSLIQAHARISFFNSRLGSQDSVFTNTVFTEINKVKAIDVSPDQTEYYSTGSMGRFVFYVRNTGNTPLNPSITYNQLPGDDFDLENVTVTLDQNGDNAVDGNDLQLAPGARIDLPLGEQKAIIVEFLTPLAVAEGKKAMGELVATDESATDLAVGTAILSTTGLAVVKSVDASTVKPNGKLRYELRVRNRGGRAMPAYSTMDGNQLLIDGNPNSGILIRDAVPLNTSFSTFTDLGGFTGLYHIAGEPMQSYVTKAPQDLATVDAIAFFRAGDYPLGSAADLAFEVSVAENATTGFISNRASTWQQVPGALVELETNLVRTKIEPDDRGGGDARTLVYLNSNGDVISTTALDTNVRLRLSEAVCNTTTAKDTVQISIQTLPEGDLETVTATETGPNSGIFLTSLLPVQRILPPVPADGILSGNRNTKATANASCQGKHAAATLRINPGGTVFQSTTNEPVPGATVVIYDGAGTEIDRVQTDGDGFYAFTGVITAGSYRLEVEASSGLIFPSARTVYAGWDRDVDLLASFGKQFTTSGSFNGVDIPLDPHLAGLLKLEKDTEQDRATPGDIVTYKLRLTNDADLTLSNLVVHDQLPEGLTFVEGSARIDDKEVPVTGDGRELTFNIGSIGRFGTLELTYVVLVDPLAEGRLTNIAYAKSGSGGGIQSNEARAVLYIDRNGGVFGDDGVVLGRVYVDFNGSGLQDSYMGVDGIERPEPGIPGVKILFETGASVVTDAEGKYSMPGLMPKTHVAAISMRTLPATLELKQISTRDAMSPQSRLIRLLPGEVASEFFALVPRPEVSLDDVVAELNNRLEAYESKSLGESSPLAGVRETLGGDGWVDYDPNTPSITTTATKATLSEIIRRSSEDPAVAGSLTGGQKPVELERTRNLESEIRGLSPELAFIDLNSDDMLSDTTISVRVKGPANGTIGLNINGTPVPGNQIGQRMIYEEGGVQALEFVAVRLQGGSNRLELTISDAFGNVRERKEVEVVAPGRATRIEVIVPPVATADPSSPIPVLIRLVDANGVPTHSPMDITLEENGDGRWGVDDNRLTEPGTQIFISSGEVLVDYYPPALAGTHPIAVSSGIGRFEAKLKLLPDDQDRVIVGVMEGVVRLNGQEIDTVDLDNFSQTAAGVRGALYLKGKIKGGALLTARYDSDRSTEERLFRDIDPERYYPVYGDQSERGFDAQSETDLYVKVEKGLNYILYGDIDFGSDSSELQLGSYSRIMTGVHGHLERGPVSIDIFVGRTSQDQVIREFRAEGISGPYDLNLADYIEGSDRVEIITRDRRQPTVELRSVMLERYTDYLLDYFDNSILFNTPIPATDDEGNPNFIRVTYEVEGDAEPYWVYSGEVRYQINERVAVGYREIRSDADEAYDDRRTMRSAYASADLDKYGRAEVELAQSIDRRGEEGYAGRVGYEVSNDWVRLRARATRTGDNFIEGSSTVSSARDEASVEADWKLSPGFDLRTSILYDRRISTGDHRWGAELLASRDVSPELRLTGGVRFVRLLEEGDDEEDGELTVPSGILGAEWRPTALRGLVLKSEVEADLTDLSHLRGSVEASHPVTDRMRAYVSADWATRSSEFLDFSSKNDMGATAKAGIEYKLSDSISTFTEARNGTQNGLAGGIKGDWKWDERRQIYASIEHFRPYAFNGLRGSLSFDDVEEDDEAQTSVAVGYLELLDGGTGRLSISGEATFEGDERTYYSQQYWSRRIRDWTFGIENRFAWSGGGYDRRLRDHLRVGAALRPAEESIDGLFVGGLRLDRDLGEDVDKATAYWAAASSLSIDPDTRLTAKQAGQYQQASVGDVTAETFLILAQLGVERDIRVQDNLRVRLGLNAPVFYDVYNHETYAGVGGEIGFVPARNVLVSAGYNWSNVEADNVADIYQKGAYMRVSMKLDDTAWNFFDQAGITVPVSSHDVDPVVYK